jgi:integrase
MPRLTCNNPSYRKHRVSGQAVMTISGRTFYLGPWNSKELVQPSVYEALRCVAGLRAGRSAARESDPIRPVSDDVVDATLPYLSSIVRAMVQFQRFTGARPGEVCAMRIGEVDRAGEIWQYTPKSLKTARARGQKLSFGIPTAWFCMPRGWKGEPSVGRKPASPPSRSAARTRRRIRDMK